MVHEVILSHLDIFLKFFVTFVVAFLIGLERELKGKPFGVRTSLLVTGGAMIFTLMSLMIDPNEPARIAAQIVTGIGFLGAGIILVNNEKNKVKNLTTAAGIWFSAAIGMGIGFGQYFIVALATVFALISSRIPNFWEKDFGKK